MENNDAALAQANQMAEALANGVWCMQLIVWRCLFAKFEATLPTHLSDLEAAMRVFIDLRDSGLTQGGPVKATQEDIERVQQLSTLVEQLLAGGKPSPELEGLARRVLEALADSGVAERLPPG